MLKDLNILIVGLGLIGGSYAKELLGKGYKIYGIDSDPKTMEYAISNGIILNENETEEDLIRKADFIIYTVYPKIIPSLIERHMPYYKREVLLTDTSGTKEILLNGVDEILDGKFKYVSHHPMAGREKSGIESAIQGLFKDANFIIIDDGVTDHLLEELACALEFKNISYLNRKDHDVVIGYLSQLTHAIAIALMNARDTDSMIKYTGDSFRDLTRIASINEKLWSELFFENKETLLGEIELFESSLNEIKKALNDEDVSRLKELMINSTERRKRFNEMDPRGKRK